MKKSLLESMPGQIFVKSSMVKVLILSVVLFSSLEFSARSAAGSSIVAQSFPRPFEGSQFMLSTNDWLYQEVGISVQRIFSNVSPSDSASGAVIAAQTRVNPNYYYHWVRDAALTAEALIQRYNNIVSARAFGGRGNSGEQNEIKQKLLEYFNFSESLQNVSTLEGLGEPKFNVDGSAFNEPWGRPQNDGPALRALSFIHLAMILNREGQADLVSRRFYRAVYPADTVIKKDLDYVAHHWRDPSFDLWEEVKGDHFYTRMVQRRALKEGAKFAASMGDPGAAQFYLQEAQKLEQDIPSFFDKQRGYFVATKNRVGGLGYKDSQLDSAIVLGLLHGSLNDGFLNFSDPRVQATMDKMNSAFGAIYDINRIPNSPGIAIGRYPEDKYGGSQFISGNPWVLCTLAFAEAYYRYAAELRKHQGPESQIGALINRAESYIARVQYHANSDGSLNEQFARNTGHMTSVRDLTWNYGSILTTYNAKISLSR